MIAEVVANTGWTWNEALDNLTLPRLAALRAEWRRHPPTHLWIAALLREPRAAGARSAAPTIDQLKAAFPDGRL